LQQMVSSDSYFPVYFLVARPISKFFAI